jgi:ABC-type transporter Mla subunit MlaD
MATAGWMAGLIACERPRSVAVQVSIPGPDSVETPVTGIGLVALPYDRDSVLGALARNARSPRPDTAELQRLFREFRGPFTAYTATAFAAGQLRDSLERLKGRLDSLPRGSDEYRERYAAFGRMNDSLVALQARTEQRHSELDRARAAFVERSETLRTAIRHWEDSTYQGYDSLTDALAAERHRQAVTDTTGADGWAHFTLDGGPWWIYGRSWDATDPNAEWYWNVPVTSDTILLSSRAGRQRPRY